MALNPIQASSFTWDVTAKCNLCGLSLAFSLYVGDGDDHDYILFGADYIVMMCKDLFGFCSCQSLNLVTWVGRSYVGFERLLISAL